MNLLLSLLIAHLLADFYFQPTKWAQEKEMNFKYMIYHGLEYAAIMGLAIFLFVSTGVDIKLFLIIAISHFLIDCIKGRLDYSNHFKQWNFHIFCIDQILHIAIVIGSFYIFKAGLAENTLFFRINTCMLWEQWTRYLLLLLFLWTPSAILVKKLMEYVFERKDKWKDSDGAKKERKNKYNAKQAEVPASAGSLIGKLERIIIASLIIYGEPGALGFVVAAKSFARYKQFENQQFTEKFLVGTLASTAIAILATKLLIK